MALTNEKSTPVPATEALVACRVCLCLATTGKMYCFETAELIQQFFNITGLEVSPGDGLPQHICYSCRGLLRKATDFRKKSHSTHKLLTSHPVTLKFIQNIHMLHGQPLQNTDIVSATFNNQSDPERYTQNHLNNEEDDKSLQSGAESDTQNHLDKEDEHEYLQSDAENDQLNKKEQNHLNKEDPESDILYSQEDTDFKWATDDNLNDNDQSDDDVTTVLDEFNCMVDKVDDEIENCIPLQEIISKKTEADTMAMQNAPNNPTIVKYNKMLHEYIQEKYVSKSFKCDSFRSGCTNTIFYNYMREKYDYDDKNDYEDAEKEWKYEGDYYFKKSKEYNFKIVYFSKKEQIENLRARIDTNNYKLAKFKCKDCYTGFQLEQKYNAHRARHDSATHGNYKCEVCKLRYPSKRDLCNHMRCHKRRFICNQCNKFLSVTSSFKLKEHFNIHNSNASVYECEHCSQIFIKKASLKDHVYRNHGTVPCGICHFMMLPTGVDRHMKRQHVQTLTCSSCHKVFDDYAAIAKHIHTSPNGVCGADAWPCTKCGENFNNESDLREHIDECRRRIINEAGPSKHTLRSSVATRRKPTRTFTCSSCNKVFDDYAAIAKHIHTSPNGVCGADAWPCTVCGENFNTEIVLRGHISGCRQVKKTRGSSHYRIHAMTHTGERPHACPECPMAFRFPVDLKRHMAVHTGERAHQCSQCGKAYTRKTILTDHRKIVHENLRPHECTICNKKFALRHYLRKHLNTVHKIEKEKKEKQKIICEWCAKIFLRRSDYHKHVKVHTGERPHACPECPKAFRTASDLRRHVNVHTDKRPHACPECPKAFRTASNLRRHVDVHTGERPHACPECPKAFRTTAVLKVHMPVHTGERAHQCSQCGKAYTAASSLDKHRKSVHLARAHQCPQCGKAFTRSTGLQLHRRTVHENLRPHECTICSMKFRQRQHLRRHLNTIHKNGKEKKVRKVVRKVGIDVKKVSRGVKKIGSDVKKVGKK